MGASPAEVAPWLQVAQWGDLTSDEDGLVWQKRRNGRSEKSETQAARDGSEIGRGEHTMVASFGSSM